VCRNIIRAEVLSCSKERAMEHAAMDKDELRESLEGVLASMHTDPARAEILAAALVVFNQPVPTYKPCFLHSANPLDRYEIDAALGQNGEGAAPAARRLRARNSA
jgi:hypothetical protein